MKKTLALLTLALTAGCSVVGIRTAEEPEYTLVEKDGDFEIREYPEVIVAETIVDAEYDDSGSIAFRRLGGYIFGDNQMERDIDMTAPVIQEAESMDIAMTAPVIQEGSGKRWVMSFVMPSEHTLDSLPTPNNPDVAIKVVPARRVAAVRYSGYTSEENIALNNIRLQGWLDSKGYTAVSAARSARYDPPWTIPFLRKNEVHLDVRQQSDSSDAVQAPLVRAAR